MNILFQSLSPSLSPSPFLFLVPSCSFSLSFSPRSEPSVRRQCYTVHTPPRRSSVSTSRQTRSDPFLVMRRTAPSPLLPLPRPCPPTYPRVGGGTQFETSEFEYSRPGPETMGTSSDHTGCEQMVEQPRDMRSGKGCSFFSQAANYPRNYRWCQLSSE